MQFDHISQSNKYLDDVLHIIRDGIAKCQLSRSEREGIKTQNLVEIFNDIGTARTDRIGVQKEHERKDNLKREDIYFYLCNDTHTRIFFVEAKRLPKPNTTNDDEYVVGQSSSGKPSGGIQRYKLLDHGSHDMRHNGMIAFIESKSIDEWIETVNRKIGNEFPGDIPLSACSYPNEYISTHKFANKDGRFSMHHFWINLIDN